MKLPSAAKTKVKFVKCGISYSEHRGMNYMYEVDVHGDINKENPKIFNNCKAQDV